MAVGPLEPKFHQKMFQVLGVNGDDLFSEPERITKVLEETFLQKTRDEWSSIFEGDLFAKIYTNCITSSNIQTFMYVHLLNSSYHISGQDCCVTPVLDIHEVGTYGQHVDRQNFTKNDKFGSTWIAKPSPRVKTPEELFAARSKL